MPELLLDPIRHELAARADAAASLEYSQPHQPWP